MYYERGCFIVKGMTNAQKDTSNLATKSELGLKANQSALDATNTEVGKKANQSALDATNATVAEIADKFALKPVSNSMEVIFDTNLKSKNDYRLRYHIMAKDGGSIPSGTLQFIYTYITTINDRDYAIQVDTPISIPISAGNTVSGFVRLPAGHERVAHTTAVTFSNGSTTYYSSGNIGIYPVDDGWYVEEYQGASQAGKVLGINSSGYVSPVDAGGSPEIFTGKLLNFDSSKLKIGSIIQIRIQSYDEGNDLELNAHGIISSINSSYVNCNFIGFITRSGPSGPSFNSAIRYGGIRSIANNTIEINANKDNGGNETFTIKLNDYLGVDVLVIY